MPIKQGLMFHKCKSCPRGDNCVCEEECSMDERANCEIFQNLEAGVPAKSVKNLGGRVKSERHLKWYQTQYWSGFISGLWFGLMCGLPFAFVVYQVAKVVVHFIEGA